MTNCWKDIKGNADFGTPVGTVGFGGAVYKHSGTLGRPCFQFTAASNHALSAINNIGSNTNEMTVIMVGNNWVAGGFDNVFNIGFTGVVPGSLTLLLSSNRHIGYIYDSTFTQKSTVLNNFPSPNIQPIRTNSGIVRRNLTQMDMISPLFGSGVKSSETYSSTPIRITGNGGSPIYLGIPTIGGRRLSATSYDQLASLEVYELIIISRFITDREVEQIQSYIHTKYNV